MKKLLLSLVLVLASCGSEVVDNIEFRVITANGETLHSWGGYHWGSNNLNVTVYNKTKSSLYDVPAGVNEWSALNTPVQFVMTNASRYANVTVMEGSSPWWLGLATIWIDGSGHIVKGEVKLNTRLLKGYSQEVADHVLCQELGHVLGLDHNHDAVDTCMNDLTAVSNPWPAPNAHDAEELNLIYGHVD